MQFDLVSRNMDATSNESCLQTLSTEDGATALWIGVSTQPLPTSLQTSHVGITRTRQKGGQFLTK